MNVQRKEFPADWPQDGPIDLTVHDLPHHSSTTEWWYMNSHLKLADERVFSVFASFFRIMIGHDKETKAPKYAHSLTWALIEPGKQEYHAISLVDKQAPEIGQEKLKRGEGTRDKRLRRAMKEVLDKGNVPYPDQIMKRDPIVGLEQLHLDFDGNSYRKIEPGRYELSLYSDHHKVGCKLTFELNKPPIRHGDNGVVKGAAGEDMFYYFIPRCTVSGELILEDQLHPVASASGWYDHEFGVPLKQKPETEGAEVAAKAPDTSAETPEGEASETAEGGQELTHDKTDVAWNWVSVQFTDGHELTAYDLFDLKKKESLGSFCVVIDQKGNQSTYNEFSFTPEDSWTSTRTFHQYPTKWTLKVPEPGYELEIQGAMPDQEFITLISKPSFWEGRIEAKGTLKGEAVGGTGFVERSGFHEVETLDQFFIEVGKETRKSVRGLIPFDPSFKQVLQLIAEDDRPDLMEGVDLGQFERTMIKPVREITDRGGKSWRSYAALACCDVVGGDSRKYVEWLAMPELMHVGSLIVDDVQDKSTWRRGGESCHLIYGEPLAINAGTACYFMGQKLLSNRDNTTAEDQLKLYDLYFMALRAGHAGQALDLEGPYDIMEYVVETGDNEELIKRVLAVHKLKTALPAGALARMGGVAGRGTKEQIDAVGFFFESVGLAFQIIDDVLNLRGFRKELKSRGEDIMHGKVTLPVAKAMGSLELKDRLWLYETIKSQPTDLDVVASCIEMIESCGALDDCVTQANDLVEEGWKQLDPKVEDSLQKLMLRAFGWYVLERHY